MKTLFTLTLGVTLICAIHSVKAQSYIIPVVFHVLHQGGNENISDAQIMDAMRILNEDYNKQNADTIDVIPYYQNNIADMQVEFRLATIDPNGNSTNGIERIFTSLTDTGNDSAKINQWNPTKYLNIWVVKSMYSGGISSTAYYPWSVADTFPNYDGVMVISNYVGSIGTSNIGNSRDITHTVGHYLCLMHLWDNGLCDDGDSVVDTPPTKFHTSLNNCIPDTPYCVPGVPPNFQNFMEGYYCGNRMFTNGQKVRVHNCLESAVAHRDSLWALPNLVATGVISGIEALRYERKALSLFPNPSTTSFTIQLFSPPASQTYFQLYDALGREVKREELNTTATTIQRGNLPTGIYFWQLTQGNKIMERGKVVME